MFEIQSDVFEFHIEYNPHAFNLGTKRKVND